MQKYIGIFYNKPERCVDYPEQSTTKIKNVVNITVDSASEIPQEKMGVRNIIRRILTEKIRQIIVNREIQLISKPTLTI